MVCGTLKLKLVAKQKQIRTGPHWSSVIWWIIRVISGNAVNLVNHTKLEALCIPFLRIQITSASFLVLIDYILNDMVSTNGKEDNTVLSYGLYAVASVIANCDSTQTASYRLIKVRIETHSHTQCTNYFINHILINTK